MSARAPDKVAANLEGVFSSIQQERFADIPILNSKLRVEAVGFQRWQDGCLGVLVTPWFMNLMLLQDEPGPLEPGSKVQHELPSGTFEFIAGEEEGIGAYQMCSLFSPVFEFEDQDAAVATAEAVMNGLMQAEAEPEHPAPRSGQMSRRDLLRGVFSGGAAQS
ncbi:MAG: [NiFe]-hydrogenase assembly chaperone HybE [Xanthomonadales bacterium]|nr:[NiFe]-hydrogenase assembly chaperone HybE [Xanthomonadales bacterium]